MIEVRELLYFDRSAIEAVMADGYTSNEKYEISRKTEPESFLFEVRRVALPASYQKVWDVTEEDFRRYEHLIQNEPCFAAFNENRMLGIALAEVRQWNRSIWVWELHVVKAYRGQGIGRKLIEAMEQAAQALNLRVVVCETQNTNVPAIDFYRSIGFELDGIDLSYYTNHDAEAGEVALFMKRKIA